MSNAMSDLFAQQNDVNIDKNTQTHANKKQTYRLLTSVDQFLRLWSHISVQRCFVSVWISL